ncbi:response regulator transcription factor [Bifidobacterium pullorum subsp. saeculare]|uniref:Response regulator transcription factor n=1 Tax=Bifidobacterium pullorum subsp. saeculare TaxID=78257 RepID=A0A939BA23_9BIFI|nr:response regulator transcription factor [Bifidobacterium pullorum]MBM6699860.1 response regulator transcription factor [Bifidobacterium pullorum subsp. saeculare]
MRVIVCDDDAVVVSSLAIVLGAQPDIEVVGTAADGAGAVRLAAELSPDIALLDIQMPGVDGLAAAERILAAPDPPRVVFLTTFSDDEYIVRALVLGAAGYLIKQDVAGVAPALRAVAAGRSVLEGEVLERAVTLGTNGAGVRGGAGAPDLAALFPQLTAREREVVALIAEGLDNRQIAETAFMGAGTVRNHISAILAKLHLRNRTQIAVAYWRALR